MAHEAIADCVTNVFTKFWRLLLEIVFSELNSKYTNYLMNQPRNPVKKLDSKLHKQRIGWPKISNTVRKIQQRSTKITTAKFWATIGEISHLKLRALRKKLVLRGEG